MNITQTGSAEDVIALALHCNKLASLKCAMCTIDTSVFEILYGCKSLETLQLVGCENRYCVGFTEPCSIELAAWWQTSKLHSVVMDGAQISNILASAFLRSLPPSHLKRLIVSWQSESVMQSTLQKLTECGHNIKSLGFARSCRLRDNHWRTMTELCPAVLHLDFSMCSSAITDASCEIIVRNLTQLRTLNVSYCDITEFGLLSLAEHRSDTLEALISFGCDNIAGWGYNTILARCHKLHTLALTTYTSTLDQLELPLLHNLTTLQLYEIEPDQFYIFEHCSCLKYLYLIDLNYMQVSHMDFTILSVANTPNLLTLFAELYNVNGVRSLAALQAMRPTLRIRNDYDRWSYSLMNILI